MNKEIQEEGICSLFKFLLSVFSIMCYCFSYPADLSKLVMRQDPWSYSAIIVEKNK